MTPQQHYAALTHMFASAPINEFYKPTLQVAEGWAEVNMVAQPQFHHAVGALHGSVYFKMLDDAAFFAAASLEQEVLMLTTSFVTYITRSVSEGNVRAVGKVVNQNKSQFVVEAVMFDAQDRELSRGSGIFTRVKTRLAEIPGYRIDPA
ncbi:MAG: PaaI family thioesterase [Burkholderiales bacterium]